MSSAYRRIPCRPSCCPQPPFPPLSEETLRGIYRRAYNRKYVMSQGWSNGVLDSSVWMWADDTFRVKTFESEAAARAFVAMAGIEERVEWRL